MSEPSSRQRGFTLLELMIALMIGLFLVGALLIVVQDNKRAFTSQNQLARLQDLERLAMTILADSIQQNGYFPDPTTNTAAALFPAQGTLFPLQGQSLMGYTALSAGADAISVRRAATGGDGLIDSCTGTSDTGATNIIGSTFFIPDVSTGNTGQIWCSQGFTYYMVVGDVAATVTRNPIQVTNMTFLYGINSTGVATNVDTYKQASQMSATDWLNVISVQITLSFTNPLYTATNGQPQNVTFSRVVDIMRQTGQTGT